MYLAIIPKTPFLRYENNSDSYFDDHFFRDPTAIGSNRNSGKRWCFISGYWIEVSRVVSLVHNTPCLTRPPKLDVQAFNLFSSGLWSGHVSVILSHATRQLLGTGPLPNHGHLVTRQSAGSEWSYDNRVNLSEDNVNHAKHSQRLQHVPVYRTIWLLVVSWPWNCIISLFF